MSLKHAPATSTLRERLVRKVSRITCAFKLAVKTINIPDNKAGAEVQVFVVEATGNDVSDAALASSGGNCTDSDRHVNRSRSSYAETTTPGVTRRGPSPLVVDASCVLLEVPNRATIRASCLSALDLLRQSCGKE